MQESQIQNVSSVAKKSTRDLHKLKKVAEGFFVGKHVMVFHVEKKNLVLYVRSPFWQVYTRKPAVGPAQINFAQGRCTT